MTPGRPGAADVDGCAVALEEMLRGAEAEALYVDGPVTVWVVCLLDCWAAAAVAEREDGGGCWRKAAKKVERKKGRWDDILVGCCGDGVGVVVSPVVRGGGFFKPVGACSRGDGCSARCLLSGCVVCLMSLLRGGGTGDREMPRARGPLRVLESGL